MHSAKARVEAAVGGREESRGGGRDGERRGAKI